MGRRSDDSPIYRPRKGPLTQTTINRYLAILGAVLSWARKRRLLPRQWTSPLRKNARTELEIHGALEALADSPALRWTGALGDCFFVGCPTMATAGGHGFTLRGLLRNAVICPAIPLFSSTLP